MVTKAKAARLSNLFLLIMGLGVYSFDRRTQRFVRKLRHILYVSSMLSVYLCFTLIVLYDADQISILEYTGDLSLMAVSKNIFNTLQILVFPLLILLGLFDGRSQANYFNKLCRFDRKFGTDTNMLKVMKRFWKECLVWHAYYNFIVNPLDSYFFGMMTVKLQLYYWAYSLSAIGIGSFISYVTLATRIYFDRVAALKTHLRANVATMDDRLAVTVGMLHDLCLLRTSFREAFALTCQILMQMMMIQSMFSIYFLLAMLSESHTVFMGSFGYCSFFLPIQLRVLMMVRQMNRFGTEVNVICK